VRRLLACLAVLAACASPVGRFPTVLLEGAPHVRQKPDYCGEACASMALRRLGRDVSQDRVFAATGLDPALGRGAYTRELHTALLRLGFDPGPVWYEVDAARAAEGLESRFAELHADLRRGFPSIVCMHYDSSPGTTEHFRLILGYDARTDEVVYHEPAEDDGAYRRMPRWRFLALWPLKYQPSRWTVIRFRLDPTPMSRPGFALSP
jgi:hypothetical protein